MKKEIKNLNELKELFSKYGYYAKKKVLIESYLALKNFGGKVKPGQDIRAISLDGPAGSGKTSFVETYSKVAKEIFDEEVVYIEYQCNDTSGKSDLYEEINVTAVIAGKESEVIIPGCVVEAFNEVNKGKKVVLLIDEFDKSRTETDAFFFNLLQSGRINTTQKGLLEIKEEYKTNLQIFFCKNDFRDLSDPLIRRTRNRILSIMTPEEFHNIAENKLSKQEGIPMSLVDLVSFIYEYAYENEKHFKRLPACSEMMIAIIDAYDLNGCEELSSSDMYELILERMFKNEEDLTDFTNLIKQEDNKKYVGLKKLLNDLETSKQNLELIPLREKIARQVLEEDDSIKSKLDSIEEKRQELERLEEELVRKSTSLGTKHEKVHLENGELTSTKINFPISNFNDSTELIKRGQNIFNLYSDYGFTEIISAYFEGLPHYEMIELIKNRKENYSLKIYEDGIYIGGNLIKLVATADDPINPTYRFYCTTPIIPSTYIEVSIGFLKILNSCCSELKRLGKMFPNANTINISINSLILNDLPLEGYEEVMSNVYHIEKENISLQEFIKLTSSLQLENSMSANEILEFINKIMNKDNSLKLEK